MNHRLNNLLSFLACYEFVGEIALKIAPLVKHRNETIHLLLAYQK
jgi:hypothetical protein